MTILMTVRNGHIFCHKLNFTGKCVIRYGNDVMSAKMFISVKHHSLSPLRFNSIFSSHLYFNFILVLALQLFPTPHEPTTSHFNFVLILRLQFYPYSKARSQFRPYSQSTTLLSLKRQSNLNVSISSSPSQLHCNFAFTYPHDFS